MRRFTISVAVAVVALSGAPLAQRADPLKMALDTLGAGSIRTLQFVGTGANFSVGQNFTPADPWPRVTLKRYTAMINYDTASMRVELLREMGATMPRGGGAPFTGEQRQTQTLSGTFAWNSPAPPAVPAGGRGAGAPPAGAPAPPAGDPPPAGPGGRRGNGPAAAPPAAGAAGGGRGPGGSLLPVPAPGSAVERMLALWSTPQGFVKAAIANNATTRRTQAGTEVSFTVGGKHRMVGMINTQNQVERVQTWIDQPIVGDMLVETVFSGYSDFGGVQFPARLVQSQDGYPALDLTIDSVTVNQPVEIEVPESVRTAPAPPPPAVSSQTLAEGVFYLTGGTHHSLAVEMRDHIVLVDTPVNEDRALAVIAKAKQLVPGKPVRYVVTTHHHWDHLGGIRTAIDEGATIVTHQMNQAFLERAAKTPHTINPDRLSRSKKALKVQTFGDMGRLTDGTRTIELHSIAGNEHAADMFVVYLPKEKILAEADAFTPPPQPTGQIVVTAVAFAGALYDNIQRLMFDVQTIAPFHGVRTTTVAELAQNARRSGSGARGAD